MIANEHGTAKPLLVTVRAPAHECPELIKNVGHRDDRRDEEDSLKGVVRGELTLVAIRLGPSQLLDQGLGENVKMSVE